MKRIAIATAALLMCAPVAFADSKPSDEEATKIKEAIAAWGCSGGTMEKETEAGGVFEIDDAECKTGQYDLKLNKDFVLTSMTKD